MMIKYLIFIVLPLVAIGCSDSITNADIEQKSTFVPEQVIVQFVSSVSTDSAHYIIESFELDWLEDLSLDMKIVIVGVPIGMEMHWVQVLSEHPSVYYAQLNHTGIELRRG